MTAKEKNYVVLDTFNSDYPIVATDQNGETLFFETEEEAYKYGEKNCQSFQVIRIER